MTDDERLVAWQRISQRQRWETLAGLLAMTFTPPVLALGFQMVAPWLSIPPPWYPVGAALAANLGLGIGAFTAFRYC